MHNILVIDDDQVILDSIGRQLRHEPFSVDFDSDPESALQKVKAKHYDLVLCDIRMRPINGIEVLRRIKTSHKDVPVMIVSAFVDDKIYEEANQLGCTGFLLKPVPKKVLIESIREILSVSNGPVSLPDGK